MSVWALIALGIVAWIGISALILLFFKAASRKPPDPPWRTP